jgi:hypothetical protein
MIMNPSLLRRLPSVDALMQKALGKGFGDLYEREQTMKSLQRVLKKPGSISSTAGRPASQKPIYHRIFSWRECLALFTGGNLTWFKSPREP